MLGRKGISLSIWNRQTTGLRRVINGSLSDDLRIRFWKERKNSYKNSSVSAGKNKKNDITFLSSIFLCVKSSVRKKNKKFVLPEDMINSLYH